MRSGRSVLSGPSRARVEICCARPGRDQVVEKQQALVQSPLQETTTVLATQMLPLGKLSGGLRVLSCIDVLKQRQALEDCRAEVVDETKQGIELLLLEYHRRCHECVDCMLCTGDVLAQQGGRLVLGDLGREGLACMDVVSITDRVLTMRVGIDMIDEAL
jgi:hypothetical protein